jgi:hypothetical protein
MLNFKRLLMNYYGRALGRGTVTDTNGAPISDATVSITNTSAGISTTHPPDNYGDVNPVKPCVNNI